jgi:hypothetical protein
MTDKPHKGRILNARLMTLGDREFAVGQFLDHPEFAGMPGHTSYIVDSRVNADGSIEIETRNSRYTLINEAPAP